MVLQFRSRLYGVKILQGKTIFTILSCFSLLFGVFFGLGVGLVG